MDTRIVFLDVVLMCLLMTSVSAIAADNGATGRDSVSAINKVAYQPALDSLKTNQTPMEKNELVFSAAPRGTQEASEKRYGPLVAYLSRAIGKKIVYSYPGSWGIYQGKMLKGEYDLLYDGPHLNGWRITKLQHHVLAKLPNKLVFVAIVKKGNIRINNVTQLAGRTVCAHAPPNLGTLTLLSKFDNPARQPIIISVDGWENIYKGLMADQCVAAIIPENVLDKHDKNGVSTKLVFKTPPMPNQAFSAGPRISDEDQIKLAQALISPEAAPYTELILREYGATSLAPATKEEFVALGDLLKNEWGYY